MSTEIILLLLRVASGVALIVFLIVLLVIIWRDYRSAVAEVQINRRVFGQLIMLRQVDDMETPTGQVYPLLRLTSLGRAPTNTIPIEDTFASSEHALIALRNGQWWLEDRKSRNGTTLNDVLIEHPVVITHGDVIGIGSVKFRIELEH